MAIKASCTVTLSCYRDTQSVTRYYKLQSSTASAPSKPTTKPPSGWSDSEPSYTSGSTNTLYFCDLTVFSDGTWAYSTVSKSSSYEAAKEAYNKAQAAQNTINNMEIGGRNLILDSAFPVGTNKWNSTTVDTTVKYMNNNSMRLRLSGSARLDVPGQYYAPYITGKQLFLTFYIMCPDVSKLTTKIDSWIGFRKEGYNPNGAINKQIVPNELTDNVWKKITIVGSNSDPANIYCTMMIEPHNPNVDIYIACPKLEYGSKGSDWSPAPEDIDNAIAKTVKTVDVEYYLSTSSTSVTGGSWSTTAPAWANGKYMWSRQKVTYVDNTTATRNQTCIAGAKGATGTGTGVESITEEYYLSTSKSSQTGGSWSTTPPTWQTGKYIWTRSKIIYKNPTSTAYTTPVCSSEWEAINDVSIGARNYLIGSEKWNCFLELEPEGIQIIDDIAIKTGTGTNSNLKRISVIPGEQISISVDIKADVNFTPSDGFILHQWDSDANNDSRVTYSWWKEPLTTEWKRYKTTITVPNISNIKYYRLGIRNNQSHTLYFRHCKIEHGNKPSDWTPAPEDIASVEQVIDINQKTEDVKSEVNSYKERLAEINVITEEIQNCISMLVTDGNGSSLMTQTEDGWTFNIDKINKSVNDISKGLDNLQNELGSTSNTINELSKAVANVSKISAYVKIRLEGNKPCIELGTGDNNFKLLITNTDIRFMEGSSVPAYINNKSLYIRKAIVEEELKQGSFSWVIHGSGNLGLMWK